MRGIYTVYVLRHLHIGEIDDGVEPSMYWRSEYLVLANNAHDAKMQAIASEDGAGDVLGVLVTHANDKYIMRTNMIYLNEKDANIQTKEWLYKNSKN